MAQQRVYLIIHGHYYQPPRENPWTGFIGKEFGADPYRNWNEKIARESYTPNAFSRVLEPDGYVVDIVNNYQYLNYNFGPTLIRWVEQYLPQTYRRILEGDAAGQGNAIAQVYNHMIMPLANERDRRTQIEWGLYDFQFRFGRRPEAMWMAETAVNMDVVELLIEYRMRYIVLSPWQAHAFRRIGDGETVGCANGEIDTTRTYRIYSKKFPGLWLDVFFYDGTLSSAVSFEHLARDAGALAGRIREAAAGRGGGDVLVNISTDGELYGHHEPFADMCLAYLFRQEAEKHGITVTHYSAYLKDHPPEHEVFLKDGENGKGTSWSCAHGVARWERDCGCTVGGPGHWNQQWRAPLRQALDALRDRLAEVFEREGGKYLKDVWAARNDYIRVIEDRSESVKDAFLKAHLIREGVAPADRTKIFSLLESQHCAQLMFTSCGWFFADISGIESVQLLKYASMAMQYVRNAFGEDFEPQFLDILGRARSNIRAFGTGADLYRKKALSSRVSPQQVLANYVMESYIVKDARDRACLGWDVVQSDYFRADLEAEHVSVVRGRARIRDQRSETVETFEYALAVHSYSDFRCYVFAFDPATPFAAEPRVPETKLRKLSTAGVFGLKDLLLEDEEAIINRALERRLRGLEESIRKIYSRNLEFLEGFFEIGIEVPEIVKSVASYVVTEDVQKAVARIEDPYNLDAYKDLRELFTFATKYSLKVNSAPVTAFLDRILADGVRRALDAQDTVMLSTLSYVLDIADEMGVKIRLDILQNMMFARLLQCQDQYQGHPARYGVDKKFKHFVQGLVKLAERLNVRFRFPF